MKLAIDLKGLSWEQVNLLKMNHAETHNLMVRALEFALSHYSNDKLEAQMADSLYDACSDNGISFINIDNEDFLYQIDADEHDRAKKFINEHSHSGVYTGAIGGTTSVTFTDTAIGRICSIECGVCKTSDDFSGRM